MGEDKLESLLERHIFLLMEEEYNRKLNNLSLGKLQVDLCPLSFGFCVSVKIQG